MNVEADNSTVNNPAVEQEITNVRDLVIQNGEKLDSLSYNVNELGSIMAENEAEEPQQEEVQQAETIDYSEMLLAIDSKLELNNQISAVHCAFFGVICGLLAIKIFIDRMFK